MRKVRPQESPQGIREGEVMSESKDFREGVLYALEYLADLFEGVEDTDLAKEYDYKKEQN